MILYAIVYNSLELIGFRFPMRHQSYWQKTMREKLMKCVILHKNNLPIDKAGVLVAGLKSRGDIRHSIDALAGGYYFVLMHDERGKELVQTLLDAGIDMSVLCGEDTREGIEAVINKALESNADLVKAKKTTELINSLFEDSKRSPFDLSGLGRR